MNKFCTAMVAAILSGCMQQPTTPIAQVPASPSPLSDVDQLSCMELEKAFRQTSDQANQLRNQPSQTAMQSAVANTALSVGAGLLIGRAGGGDLESIRTASTIGTGLQDVLATQTGQGRASNAGGAIALAQRSADLQRAMIRRGC